MNVRRKQQKGKVWRVGFLAPQRRPDSLGSDIFGAFSDGMRELGYVEGKNLVIEWRFADGHYERLSGLAEDLVRVKVDVIVTLGTAGTSAAQKATTRIPIVMGSVNDPVASGFVKSLARPGGNITGLSNIASDVGPKLLEMLHGMVPKLSRVAVLLNPANSSHATRLKSIEGAAHRTGVTILTLEARTPEEVETAFLTVAPKKAEAIIVMRDTFFNQQVHQIAELAAKHRLPSIAGIREYVEAGGLMSYGPSLRGYFRHAATYVDKICKGARPGDLPVEQPTKLELFINRTTAKALGLTIPRSLLIIADTVIE